MYYFIKWLYLSLTNGKTLLITRGVTLLVLFACALAKLHKGSAIVLGVAVFIEILRFLFLRQYKQVFALMCTLSLVQLDAKMTEAKKDSIIQGLMDNMNYVQRVIYDVRRNGDMHEMKDLTRSVKGVKDGK